MKKLIFLLLLPCSGICQQHHVIQSDTYEQAMLNADDAIFAKLGRLNNVVSTSNDPGAISKAKRDMEALACELKQNIDSINQYEKDKLATWHNHQMDNIKALKELNLWRW